MKVDHNQFELNFSKNRGFKRLPGFISHIIIHTAKINI